MIVWCRGCDVTELSSPGICWTCKFVEAIQRPIDVEALLGLYHVTEYFGPREFNTVNLNELKLTRKNMYLHCL